MLEDLNNHCVDFKPNYDETTEEPVVLPSKFPYLLCGNNSGIAVGMSSDLVSHNFTEVYEGIKYFVDHKDCSVEDLMKFIKGPDLPMGCRITNGDELLEIYKSGRGTVRVIPKYTVSAKGNKTLVTFHSIPYGVEYDTGIKKALKDYVIEEDDCAFEDIELNKTGPKSFEVVVTLARGVNVNRCIDILLQKTKLSTTVKINNTVIINGEPRTLNLKELVEYWVNYRSEIIKRIAVHEHEKTSNKLTIVLGLQKCLSDIDALIRIVRESANRNEAKEELMKFFDLSDEQANAVLDIKLSRLNRLDLQELTDEQNELEQSIIRLTDKIENEHIRELQIISELEEIKAVVGKDERQTVIEKRTVEEKEAEINIMREWKIYRDGLEVGPNTLVDVTFAVSAQELLGFTADGEGTLVSNADASELIGVANMADKTKLLTISSGGLLKVSMLSDYKFNRKTKLCKLKDGESLVYAAAVNDDESILILGTDDRVLRLSVKDLPVAAKGTQGLKCGYTTVVAATLVKTDSVILMVTKEGKGKYVAAKDFGFDSRGNKGQKVAANTVMMKTIHDNRESFFIKSGPKNTLTEIKRDKVIVKGRQALGASISAKVINEII